MSDIEAKPGKIFSPAFDDCYFSHVDGFGETQHVFMGGNGLPQRFREQKRFCVAELGFGTGLNCLCTWLAWRDMNPTGTLVYVGYEMTPLTFQQVKTTLEPWPQLHGLLDELWAEDLPNTKGWHVVKRDGLELHLAIGDAREMVKNQPVLANSWYLDGFAPDRNPELWDAGLLKAVFEKTATGGTAATYSAARMVRDNLTMAGFRVEKKAGFAQKRDMVVAYKPE